MSLGRRTTEQKTSPGKAGARDSNEPSETFSEHELETIQEREKLRAPLIYEVLRREGDQEMERPVASLWWSGVAAGLSISFSLLTQAILRLRLPDTPWRPLVADFGYPVGFLMVVLGRQQLFTENTITAVLPVVARPGWSNLRRLGRLWSVVLAANLAGTLIAALFCTFTPVLAPEIRGAMLDISRESVSGGATLLFFRAIASGFLIAAMVWLIPNAEGAAFLVITMMTYVISIGGFAHVVAGSFEAFMLLVNARLGWLQALTGFGLPVLAGNIVGGTALFTLISYAQVASEVP